MDRRALKILIIILKLNFYNYSPFVISSPSSATTPLMKGKSFVWLLKIKFFGLSVKNAPSESGSSVGVHVSCRSRKTRLNIVLVLNKMLGLFPLKQFTSPDEVIGGQRTIRDRALAYITKLLLGW